MAEQRKSDIRHFRDLDVYRRAFDTAMEMKSEKFCYVEREGGKGRR